MASRWTMEELKHIQNPRRILFLGPPDSGVLSLLKDLTGSAPNPGPVSPSQHAPSPDTESASHSTTTAGLNHNLSIKTKYYTADVPIWLDELPSLDPAAVETWKQDFLGEDASDVIQAVGGWVVVFKLSNDPRKVTSTREWLASVCASVRAVVAKAHNGLDEEDITEWDGVMLAVGIPDGEVHNVESLSEPAMTADDWDDICFPYGFEYVDAGAKPTAQSSSMDKVGLARIKEALEANEWDAIDGVSGEEDDFEEFENAIGVSDAMKNIGIEQSRFEEGQGFSMERAEMEREFAGLKMELDGQRSDGPTFDAEEWQMDQQRGVEELESMMKRLQAVKDKTSHLPEIERKRAAAKAVQDVMRNIGD